MLLGLFVTRGTLILQDLLVLLLTWVKTFRVWQGAKKTKVHVAISTCLLRDGERSALLLDDTHAETRRRHHVFLVCANNPCTVFPSYVSRTAVLC